jgi:hypothetical protein
MLTKKIDSEYLDARNVNFAGSNTALAYLIGASGATARNDTGFVRFHLKDINGLVVHAVMFNVVDLLDKGFSFSLMKKKPVRVTFTAGEYMGGLSLVVSNISVWEGEFDYGKFMGRLENAGQILEDLYTSVNEKYEVNFKFPASYVNDSYLSICSGLGGGYVKYIEMVIKGLDGLSGTPGVVMKDLVMCTFFCLGTYAKYLEMREKLDVVLKHEIISKAYTTAQALTDERLKNICVDASTALAGLGKPQHLYANIIYGLMTTNEKLLQYSYMYPLIMDGSTRSIGDDLLSKY